MPVPPNSMIWYWP